METNTTAAGGLVRTEGLGQVALMVQDLARSKTFYQEKLGLTFLFDGGPMSFFQCGGLRLMLGKSETSAPVGGSILYFRVADIQAAHQALAASGVEFVQAPVLAAKMPDHDLWLAFFKDPDGHTLAFMSEVSRRAS